MTKPTSLRQRIKNLALGESLLVPRTEYLPSVVRVTAYSVMAYYRVRYTTALCGKFTKVERVE